MVGAVGYEESRFYLILRQEDGGDERDVGQVGAAAEWVVQDNRIAGLHGYVVDGGADAHGHGAQVHGQVVALRDGVAFAVVEGAGVVQAFLDVRAEAGAAERHAHLFRNGNEDGLEDFEFDGIENFCSLGIRQARLAMRVPGASMCQAQPGGMTLVDWPVRMMAGPASCVPATRCSRRYIGVA